MSTSVGLKVLDIMKDGNMCKKARESGYYLKSKLEENLQELNVIKEIRCKGLMVGIELKKECLHLAQDALENGLVINITKQNTIRMLPPLIIDETHIDEIVSILKTIIGKINYD